MLCDCAKSGKEVNPKKTSNGEYVCANCGLILSDDYDPNDELKIINLYKLGTEMDFSNVNHDAEEGKIDAYANRLRTIADRVDDEDQSWIVKKHDALKIQAVKLGKKIGLNDQKKIVGIVDQLIELRMQDYHNYDLLPSLAVLVVTKESGIEIEIDDLVEKSSGINADDLNKYYKIFSQRIM